MGEFVGFLQESIIIHRIRILRPLITHAMIITLLPTNLIFITPLRGRDGRNRRFGAIARSVELLGVQCQADLLLGVVEFAVIDILLLKRLIKKWLLDRSLRDLLGGSVLQRVIWHGGVRELLGEAAGVCILSHHLVPRGHADGRALLRLVEGLLVLRLVHLRVLVLFCGFEIARLVGIQLKIERSARLNQLGPAVAPVVRIVQVDSVEEAWLERVLLQVLLLDVEIGNRLEILVSGRDLSISRFAVLCAALLLQLSQHVWVELHFGARRRGTVLIVKPLTQPRQPLAAALRRLLLLHPAIGLAIYAEEHVRLPEVVFAGACLLCVLLLPVGCF